MERKKNSLRQELLTQKARVGIWGCGYIGLTTASNFAFNGVKVIGYDIDHKTVNAINQGRINIPNLESWLGYSIGSLVRNKLLSATVKWENMLEPDIRVHLVAVPTEKNGEPWENAIIDVISKISLRKTNRKKPDLIIIESTLTPGDFDKIIIKELESSGKKAGVDIYVGLAPRRDWFESPEKNLKSLPRVIGGINDNSVKAMMEVLGIVSDRIIPASSAQVAELVKSVENSLLHVPAVYAMQLARAYPDVDIKEVLKLASTHWRIPLYFPSIGTGGYCIPLSTKYVIKGSHRKDCLTIGKEAIKGDIDQTKFVADLLVRNLRRNAKVGILGLAYKADLKIHILSPTLKLIEHLKKKNIETFVHDPYYSSQEIRMITGCKTFKYPRDLPMFKILVIIPGHRLYLHVHRILNKLRKGQIIIDNSGVWLKFKKELTRRGILYRAIGDRGWTKLKWS